jgi:hypothetical protein
MAVATAAVGGKPPGQAALLWLGAATFLGFVYTNIIILEQEFLSGEFGDDFALYCQSVPALVPTGLRQKTEDKVRRGEFSLNRALTFERTTLMWQGLIWAFLLWKIKE